MTKAVKYPKFGWVHVSVPLEFVLRDNPSREDLARYYRCFKCGGTTEGLFPDKPEVASIGCTLQAVVVGVAP